MAFVTAPDFAIKSIQWSLKRPAQINVGAYNGVRTVTANPWFSQWSATVDLAFQQGESGFRSLRSFFARCRGSVNVFRLYATPELQNANFGVAVTSTAAQGATSLTINGYTTALTDGQFFTVNGQLCLCTANQAGGVLTFEPPLRQQATAGTTVVTSRPYALVYLANPEQTWQEGNWRLFTMSFGVAEAINETDAAAPEQSTFTPSSLFASSQNGVWYDPSDLTTLYQSGTRASPGPAVAADGDPVGLVLDKSGNQVDLVQATSTKRPLYKTSAGLSWLQFDGVDDGFQSSITLNLSASAQLGATCGFAPLSTATSVLVETDASFTTANGDILLISPNNAAAGQISAGVGTVGSDTVQTTSTAFGSGVTSVVSFQSLDITQAAAASKLPMRRNGAAVTVTAPSDAGTAGTVFSNKTLSVGGRGGGTTLAFSGKLFGLIIRAGAFSSPELASVETWIGAKSGLSL